MANRIFQLRMKRLNNELLELRRNPLEYADTYPVDDDMLEWIFELFGPEGTDFADGVYFGKIVLPPTYPSAPPDFYMLTPSGRFTTDTKICLTISGYHKESWTPAWSIRSILIGLLSIMLDDFENGISHIHRPSVEKKKLAAMSKEFNKTKYPDICKRMDQLADMRVKIFKLKEDKKKESELESKSKEESKKESKEPSKEKNVPKIDLDKCRLEVKKIDDDVKKKTYVKKK